MDLSSTQFSQNTGISSSLSKLGETGQQIFELMQETGCLSWHSLAGLDLKQPWWACIFVSVGQGKLQPKQLKILEGTGIFPNVVFFKCCLKSEVYSGPFRISLQISPRCLYVSSCFITSCSYSPKTVQGKRRNDLAGRSLRPVS